MPGVWLAPKRKAPSVERLARDCLAELASSSATLSVSRVDIGGRDKTGCYAFQARPSTAPANSSQSVLDGYSARPSNDWIWARTTKNAVSHPRQKSPRRAPPEDGAGLLLWQRYHGRKTPLLGTGSPPQDGVETNEIRRKAWHPQHSHLLQKRDILGQNGFIGVEERRGRPSKRIEIEPLHLRGLRTGCTMQPAEREVQWHPSRGLGHRPRYMLMNTAARTIGGPPGLTMEDVDPLEKPRTPFARRVAGFESPPSHPDLLMHRPFPAPGSYRRRSEREGPNRAAAVAIYAEAKSETLLNRGRGEGTLVL
eukprot:jgi/Botrbrau1/15986/Bobra.0375s0008.2